MGQTNVTWPIPDATSFANTIPVEQPLLGQSLRASSRHERQLADRKVAHWQRPGSASGSLSWSRSLAEQATRRGLETSWIVIPRKRLRRVRYYGFQSCTRSRPLRPWLAHDAWGFVHQRTCRKRRKKLSPWVAQIPPWLLNDPGCSGSLTARLCLIERDLWLGACYEAAGLSSFIGSRYPEFYW